MGEVRRESGGERAAPTGGDCHAKDRLAMTCPGGGDSLLSAPRQAGSIDGAARSLTCQDHKCRSLPDTPALPKKHRDNVAGGARENRRSVRELHPPDETGTGRVTHPFCRGFI